MKKYTVALVGAGARGRLYTDLMADMPEKYQVVAVAEPIKEKRDYVRDKHGLSEDMCFEDWESLFSKGKIADILVIATMDKEHYEPVMKAISLKYDMLLEKPVSTNPEECKNMADYVAEVGVKVLVCHVLRYSPVYMTIKKLVDDGVVGKIISVNAEECVGDVHHSHSFVRGNFGNTEKSSFMLLQKCCHDLDILQWIIGKKCKQVQSFGTLTYFRKENAPEGSPEYCYQGCPVGNKCPYNAVDIYLEGEDRFADYRFRELITSKPNAGYEARKEAIKTRQFGKCVFKCDNDVVDHQTLNMLYEDDITVTFTMNAFTKGGRNMHIMGTKGELVFDGSDVKVFDFLTRETTTYPIIIPDEKGYASHGGGDYGIICSLYDYISGIYNDDTSLSEIGISVENHLTVFAAEKSRLENKIIDVDEYIESLK